MTRCVFGSCPFTDLAGTEVFVGAGGFEDTLDGTLCDPFVEPSYFGGEWELSGIFCLHRDTNEVTLAYVAVQALCLGRLDKGCCKGFRVFRAKAEALKLMLLGLGSLGVAIQDVAGCLQPDSFVLGVVDQIPHLFDCFAGYSFDHR